MLLIRNSSQLIKHPSSLLLVFVLGLIGWSILSGHFRTQASVDPPRSSSAIHSSVSLLPQALPTPVALYRFDGDFTDSSGNGNDFNRILGTPPFVTGKFGQAVQIQHTLARIERDPLANFPTQGNPWTIALWVKSRPLTATDNRSTLFGLFFGNSGAWDVALDYQNRIGVLTYGSQFRPPALGYEEFFSSLQIPNDNNFHHLVVRYYDRNVTFTVDGASSATIFVRYEPWYSFISPNLFIAPTDADIDEFVIIDRLLTDSEITQLQTGPYEFGNSPPAALCKNINVSANSSCQASITPADVNDGSSDPEDGTNVTLALDSSGPFGLGPHVVMLTVTDSQESSSSCSATVTVADTTPPSITPPGPSSVPSDINCQGAIPNVLAQVGASDNCSSVTLQQSPTAGTLVGVGPHTITVTATDASTNSSSATTTFTVIAGQEDDDGDGIGDACDPEPFSPRFLVIDKDSIDNGNPPNYFSASDVNDDISRLARRTPLRAFDGLNIGRVYTLYTGQVGDEGWFALKTIPTNWITAGPTADGLRNFIGNPAAPYPHGVGNGLGTGSNPESRLGKIPNVTPLRATGLAGLVGKPICAVVYDNDIIINYGPLNGSLKGENLGTVAFRLLSSAPLFGQSSGSLPFVRVQVLDARDWCNQRQKLYLEAPVPRSSSEPYDTGR